MKAQELIALLQSLAHDEEVSICVRERIWGGEKSADAEAVEVVGKPDSRIILITGRAH